MRCKEMGLYRVMWEHKEDRKHKRVRIRIVNYYYYSIIIYDVSHVLCLKVINPRRACAERVTVVVSCVCMYVCMSVRTRYSGSTRN